MRPGGKFAMPGLMKTILDIGLSDACVRGLAGTRDAMSLDELATIDPRSYCRLVSIMERLEQRHPDLRRIAFTIERGELWVL